VRDYLKEYNKLDIDVENEMIRIFQTLSKKIGSQPLIMGKDMDGKSPMVHPKYDSIAVRFEMKLDGYFTKVNHIIWDRHVMFNKIVIKGFQLMRGRYRFKPFSDLQIEDKILVINKLKEIYDEILNDRTVVSC